ncbi:hypothetical protein LG293_15910 (plasmid) [Citricoccus nitrophenolicus]
MSIEPFQRTATGLVQVIVLLVDRDSPAAEADGLAATALASVEAYRAAPKEPAWEVWLSGPFTKSVRRADAKAYAKVKDAHPEAVEAVIGDAATSTARALAFAPLLMDSLPKTLAKLQVTGTQLPQDKVDDRRGSVRILLNQDLGMTTGKAAAQAAHALLAWWLLAHDRDETVTDWWEEAGRPVAVEWARSRDLRAAQNTDRPGPLIRDAGHTEIEPGSVTAIAII